MRIVRFSSMVVAGIALMLSGRGVAQMSLSTAVDLALGNNPKIKMAQADYAKARAALSETRDAYVPAVVANGGVGKSEGVPVGLPVIFSMAAQSLAFNFSQTDYVRSARAGVSAADFALKQVRAEAAEDAVTTYVTLDNALQRQAALTEANSFAARLVQITQDRFDAGVEPHIELTRSKRTAVQLRLQKEIVQDEIASLADHLARITGVRSPQPETVHDSIPQFAALPETTETEALANSDGLKSALANATAKSYVAHGDRRYSWLPQFAFSAGYSRISTFGNNYIQYYPGFNPATHPDISYNSLDIGVQISLPLLDLVHQAKARGSAAEAARSHFDVENQRMLFAEGRLKLQHAASQLSARAELASLDRDLAQDQLDAIEVQLKAASANPDSPQMTPRDEQNARLQERQRFVEYLDAELQLRQTEINLMRQNGELGDWLHIAITQPVNARHPVVPPSVRTASNPRP